MAFCLSSLYVINFAINFFQLKIRENLFHIYAYDMIFPIRERLVFEVGIKMKNRSFICFGIIRKELTSRIKKEGYEDLKTMCT